MAALRDERVRAAAFTGSTSAGRALADIAASRPTPIPFYGELGSVNPVFVTEAALRENPADIAEGYVTSVSGSCGQLCTKPGFLFVPSHTPLADVIVEAAAKVGEHRALTPGITAGYARRRDGDHRSRRRDDAGFRFGAGRGRRYRLGHTDIRGDVGQTPWPAAGDELLDEAFGPLSVIVEYDDAAALPELAERLFPGNLTATVHAASGEDTPGTGRAGAVVDAGIRAGCCSAAGRPECR